MFVYSYKLKNLLFYLKAVDKKNLSEARNINIYKKVKKKTLKKNVRAKHKKRSESIIRGKKN